MLILEYRFWHLGASLLREWEGLGFCHILDIFSYKDTVGQLVRKALVAECLCTLAGVSCLGFSHEFCADGSFCLPIYCRMNQTQKLETGKLACKKLSGNDTDSETGRSEREWREVEAEEVKEGWPDFLNAESDGAKTVAEGDCSKSVSATTSSVRAMETKPESERTSAASNMASRRRSPARENERMKKKEA
ncbi:hypothetical protein VNO80_16973 [Phaseolus coccineus]|uniref:Uncharacterized protein n=1 Tax=Phaseolus coccineus TaxID=3886 RepID=A0AAN9R8G8_PHACN